MDGLRFERNIVTCFNTEFENTHIHAIAYRFERASRFTVQPADILIDSANSAFYCAIECKSFEPKGAKLYFSSAFSDATGVPQLERMHTFLTLSGRAGIIAIEIKVQNRLNAYLLDFDIVYGLFLKGVKGVSLATVKEKGQHLERRKGNYFFNPQDE
jgi:hypothetical protein